MHVVCEWFHTIRETAQHSSRFNEFALFVALGFIAPGAGPGSPFEFEFLCPRLNCHIIFLAQFASRHRGRSAATAASSVALAPTEMRTPDSTQRSDCNCFTLVFELPPRHRYLLLTNEWNNWLNFPAPFSPRSGRHAKCLVGAPHSSNRIYCERRCASSRVAVAQQMATATATTTTTPTKTDGWRRKQTGCGCQVPRLEGDVMLKWNNI